MIRTAVTIGLLLLLVSVRANGDEEVPHSVNADSNSKLVVQKLLADWQSHRPDVKSGEFVWRLTRQTRTAGFGSSPTVDHAANEEHQQHVHVHFNSQGLRLEGACEPSIQFGAVSLPDNSWKSNREFSENLISGHPDENTQRLSSVFYTVLVDGERETHFWRWRDVTPLLVTIFPVGTSGPLLSYDSTKTAQISLLLALIEPLRLAAKPELLFSTEDFSSNARVLPLHPMVEGRECVVIQFPLAIQPADGLCELWLDSQRDYSVMRATFQSTERALWSQYDIEYDCQEPHVWLPSKITILQFNSFGDAYDELQAVRESFRLNSEDEVELLSFQPPPGAWVIDQLTQEQYSLGDSGAKHMATLTEAVKAVTSHGESDRTAFSGNTGWDSIEAQFIRFVTWPWVLVTLVFVYGIRRVGRLKPRQKHSAE